jgi:spermidine synthase
MVIPSLTRVLSRAVAAIFFISGAAGLIFEVVWLYRSGLAFGNSTWATSLVLSSFMTGLALGSATVAVFGRRLADQFNLYALYASLEVITGAFGVITTYTLERLTTKVAPLVGLATHSDWSVNVTRFVVAFALLLVPAAAMGATLPVLVAAVSRLPRDVGRQLGRLYGWNTFGAVVGVFSTELLLVDRLGVTGSAWIAASLNGIAAAAAWLISRVDRDLPSGEPPVAPRGNLVPRGNVAPRLLTCAFLAGAILMAFEIVWFRFLSMFAVASTLTVSVMLGVVLTAIACGGLLAAAMLKRRARMQAEPRILAGVAVVALGAACVASTSYRAFGWVTGGPWAAEWYRILWQAVVLTFPTALLSGALLTLIAAGVIAHIAVPSRSAPPVKTVREAPPNLSPGGLRAGGLEMSMTGRVILANTAGAALGPLVATFVLLPRIGMERSIFGLAASYLVIGALSVRQGTIAGGKAPKVVWATAVVAIVLLAVFPFGSMRDRFFPRSTADYAVDGSRIVATLEGRAETILLMQKDWLGEPLYHRLVTNGFSMSGTHLTGKRYMRYFVYWPMLLHHQPLRRVLVVCYGVGVTAGAAASIGAVESLDVVEISREIPAMSALIYRPEDNPLLDPRLRLHIEDGRYFLQATGDRFDLITGEPPPPLTPGTVSLYTREYFQLLRDRLADGGMVTYWLPVAQRGEYDLKPIIAAFCDVFEDCSLWNGTVFDWMLVGTRHASGPVSESNFTNAWNDPAVWPKLREIGFEVPEEIGATFLADAADLRRMTADTAPVTDNRPRRLRPAATRLTIRAPQPVLGRDDQDRAAVHLIQQVTDPVRARERFEQSPLIKRLFPSALVARTIPFFDLQVILNRIMFEGADPLGHIEELDRLLKTTSLRRLPLWCLGSDDLQQQIAESANDATGMREYVFGIRALVARNYPAAAEYFAAAENRGLTLASIRPLRAYALSGAGNWDGARDLARNRGPDTSTERHFWEWLNSQPGANRP